MHQQVNKHSMADVRSRDWIKRVFFSFFSKLIQRELSILLRTCWPYSRPRSTASCLPVPIIGFTASPKSVGAKDHNYSLPTKKGKRTPWNVPSLPMCLYTNVLPTLPYSSGRDNLFTWAVMCSCAEVTNHPSLFYFLMTQCQIGSRNCLENTWCMF